MASKNDDEQHGYGGKLGQAGNDLDHLSDNLEPQVDDDDLDEEDFDEGEQSEKGRLASLNDHMPQSVQKVTGAAGRGYRKFNTYTTGKISNMGMFKHTKESTISKAINWLTVAMVGTGGWMWWSSSQNNQTYDSNPVCSVQNDAGTSYEGSVSGASGEFTKKGTKEYNTAVRIFKAAKSHGLDDKHAAALLGNGIEESAGLHNVDQHQIGGGPGVGIFQFNNPPKDMSPEGQVTAILNNKLRGIDAAGFNKQSGSMADLVEDFRADFEGGNPNPQRLAFATKAYSMFAGMAGDDASVANANAGTAEAGNASACGQSGDSSDSGSDLVNWAKKMIGWFTYGRDAAFNAGAPKIKPGNLSDVDKHWVLDCSGFVYTVMKIAGYNVPDYPFATPAMETDARGSHHWLKAVSQVDNGTQYNKLHGKKGDILIANTNGPGGGSGQAGHTAILEEDWHGADTKVAEEGGVFQPPSANEKTVGYAFHDMLSDSRVHFTIASPVKK